MATLAAQNTENLKYRAPTFIHFMKTAKLFFVFLFVSLFHISTVYSWNTVLRDCRTDTQLRDVISEINRSSTDSENLITLPSNCHITLTGAAGEDNNVNGDLDLKKNITIRGTNPQSTSINGGGIDRIFHILKDPRFNYGPRADGPSVTLENITLENGNVNGAGGAILVGAWSQLTLRNSIIINNQARGEVTIQRSQSIRNYRGENVIEPVTAQIPGGEGGGIFVGLSGRANLENVAIAHNQANSCGGGLCNYGSTTLNRVTIDNNTANYYGGGIGNGSLSYRVTGEAIRDALRDDRVSTTVDVTGAPAHSLVLTNVTIYGNRVNGLGNGGGLANVEGSTAYINNSTLSANIAGYNGGGISNGYYRPSTPIPPPPSCSEYRGTGCPGIVLGGSYEASPSPGSIYLKNSIIADNQADLTHHRLNNCEGPIASQGYNISNDDTCHLQTSSLNDLQSDPLLLPFGNYFADYPSSQAVTWNTALDPTSPAINRIPQSACIANTPDGPQNIPTDSRLIPRPQGGRCDVGAFEGEARFSVAPTMIDFGTYHPLTDMALAPRTIRIENTGFIPAQVRSSRFETGTHFTISRNTCNDASGNPRMLNPRNACSIDVSFNPGSNPLNSLRDGLNIMTTAMNGNTPTTGLFSINITAASTGLPGSATGTRTPRLRITPSTAINLNTRVGVPVNQEFSVTNEGEDTNIAFELSSRGDTSFSISSEAGSTTCNPSYVMRTYDTCRIIIVFNPPREGNVETNLSIRGNGTSDNFNIQGSATNSSAGTSTSTCGNSICETGETVSCPADCAPITPPPPPAPATTGTLFLTPNPLVFAPIASGASAEQNLEVKNTGSTPVSLDDAYPGTDSSAYSVSPGTCTFGSTLSPGLTCNLLVRFTPTVSGSTLGGEVKVVFNGATQSVIGTLQGSSLPGGAGASRSLEVSIRSPGTSSGPEVRIQANTNIPAICIYKLDGIIVHTDSADSTNHEFSVARLRNGSHTLVLSCRNGDLNGEGVISWTSSRDSPTTTSTGPGSGSPGGSPSVGATGVTAPGTSGGVSTGGTGISSSDPEMSGGGTSCSLSVQNNVSAWSNLVLLFSVSILFWIPRKYCKN